MGPQPEQEEVTIRTRIKKTFSVRSGLP